MSSREIRASLLWGLVGLLAFLVLIQGYELATDAVVDGWVKAVVAMLVGVVAVMATHTVRERMAPGRNESP